MEGNQRITNFFSSRVISTFFILANASKFLVDLWMSEILRKEQRGKRRDEFLSKILNTLCGSLFTLSSVLQNGHILFTFLRTWEAET